MRVVLGALIGLMVTVPAAAADITDVMWMRAPSRDAFAKAYPASAAKAGLAGSAHLRCTASEAGDLRDCAVVDETPPGQGFGAAAIALAAGMQLAPTSQSGQFVASKTVLLPVSFAPDVLRPGAVITHPDWLNRPSPEEFESLFPSRAAAQERSGVVLISCVVTGQGAVDDCTVVSESPQGFGFGEAALAISSHFHMRPMTVDGQPVGGAKVSIPITFGPGLIVHQVKILPTAPWSAVPTAPEMAAAFPMEAVGRSAVGHVVLRCGLVRDGSLKACDILTEDPKGQGFSGAARSLVKDFRFYTDPKSDTGLESMRVDVPFTFGDPSGPRQRPELADPLWLQRPSPEAAAKLFPAAAAKAGLKQGTGVVDCELAHTGSLTACAVVQEDPPGYGFGASAVVMAGLMQMNPWTNKGTPVDGARIRLPIILKLPDDAPAPQGSASRSSGSP